MEEAALLRLQSERQEWHNDLDSLLEGNFASEDLDLAVSLARYAGQVSPVITQQQFCGCRCM